MYIFAHYTTHTPSPPPTSLPPSFLPPTPLPSPSSPSSPLSSPLPSPPFHTLLLQEGLWAGRYSGDPSNAIGMVLFPCPQPHCICQRMIAISLTDCLTLFDPEKPDGLCFNGRTGWWLLSQSHFFSLFIIAINRITDLSFFFLCVSTSHFLAIYLYNTSISILCL